MALEVAASLPVWLTEEYITNLLCKRDRGTSLVKILDVSQASAMGDNYLGSLYRITVECNSSRKPLIVKFMPSGNKDGGIVSSFQVCQRELSMYQDTLPKLYSFMREKLGDIEYFSPLCYLSSRTDAIFLEDLRPLGYQMADRNAQLDKDHAVLVFSALAKLHAFSYAMGPESYRHYHDIFYSQKTRHLSEGFSNSIFRSFCRTVSKWEGYEKYASALRRFSESLMDRYVDATRPREGTFCVLNHGDCWTNNILFRYCPKTGAVQDVKLIDYQLARYSSPVLDLIYFMYSSLRLDVWRHQDELLRHYHEELSRWLMAAGCGHDVYPFHDLQKDLKDKLAFALTTVSTVSAAALIRDPADAPDVEKLFRETGDSQVSELEKGHGTEQFRTNVQEFLMHFEKEGLLTTESS